jgi:hypothetical protein
MLVANGTVRVWCRPRNGRSFARTVLENFQRATYVSALTDAKTIGFLLFSGSALWAASHRLIESLNGSAPRSSSP